jgi:hypothetical protein
MSTRTNDSNISVVIVVINLINSAHGYTDSTLHAVLPSHILIYFASLLN